MTTYTKLWVASAAALMLACTSNPAEPIHDDENEELTVTLTVLTEHVHTLAAADFEVSIKDHHGAAVMDFESILLEYRLEGATEWRGVEMTPQVDRFGLSHVFYTSGEYELRVSGHPHGGAMGVLHDPHMHLDVGRAHAEVGEMRIEFESFPGHLHEGEEATLKFWVLDKDPDANGVRHPITGLTAAVHCEEEAGYTEEHDAHEHEPGVYEAHHTFQEAGGFHAEMHVTDPLGAEHHVDFHTHVAHAH